MAAVESRSKIKCVCSMRITKLEDVVKELDSRLHVVEECLLGMDGMRGRMFQLEKSMENALDRIMPRLDALLAVAARDPKRLPASATSQIASKPPLFPPFPQSSSPTSSSPQATAAGPTANTAPAQPTRSKPAGGSASTTAAAVSQVSTASPKNGTVTTSRASVPASKTKTNSAGVEYRILGATSAPGGKALAKAPAEKCVSSDNKAAGSPNNPLAGTVENEREKMLREAAAKGDVVMIQKIILQGVDSKKRDPSSGDTALHCAARGGHLGAIMLLLAVAKNAVVLVNKQRETPLMVAATMGHVAAVQLLLHQGRSCWSSKQGGGRALKQAASDGKDDILQALLDGGVSANLEENVTGPSALLAAVSNGHIECVRLLIERGADLTHSNGDGQTALHKAAMNGHTECVEALLVAGANPSDKDSSGWEPLHLAARSGHINSVKLLLAKVDMNSPTDGGLTPFVCDTSECSEEVEEALRAAGASIESSSDSS